MEIKEMTMFDYPEVSALWHKTTGISNSVGDDEESVGAFLAHNPGLSLVARDKDHLVGSVLCGSDGRRGYLHHLVIAPEYRRQGLGRLLVIKCLGNLKQKGNPKCHVFVFTDNVEARSFWKRIGWEQRIDLVSYSQFTGNSFGSHTP